MLESNLYEGNQKITRDIKKLQYGISVTDKCIGWEETEEIILSAHQNLSVDKYNRLDAGGISVSGISR